MKITEKEFDAIEMAVDVAFGEGMMNPAVCNPALEKMREVYKRYRWFIDSLDRFDPSELMREYQEEFGK